MKKKFVDGVTQLQDIMPKGVNYAALIGTIVTTINSFLVAGPMAAILTTAMQGFSGAAIIALRSSIQNLQNVYASEMQLARAFPTQSAHFRYSASLTKKALQYKQNLLRAATAKAGLQSFAKAFAAVAP
jgi:hypothetical protein